MKLTLDSLVTIIPAFTALVAAITGLIVAVRGQAALAAKQDSIIAASAARDTKLNEVHAAVVPSSDSNKVPQ